MEITDDIRRRTVAEHIAAGRTQGETRAAFELATGTPLGERTLREWIKRFGPRNHSATLDDGPRVVLVHVLQRIRELQKEIEAVLTPPTGTSAPSQPAAAAPASAPRTTSPAAPKTPAAGSQPADIPTEAPAPKKYFFDD